MKNDNDKLLENEVIEFFAKWLKKEGWGNIETSLDHSRGIDLKAEKSDSKEVLIIEAKGAR